MRFEDLKPTILSMGEEELRSFVFSLIEAREEAAAKVAIQLANKKARPKKTSAAKKKTQDIKLAMDIIKQIKEGSL
jgi:hypothetical protein